MKDKLYKAAVKAGCTPFWYDGIFGWAWHCGCGLHHSDSQCSMITFASLKRR